MTETTDRDPVLTALAEQDAQLSAQGLEVWLGVESTFTDRFSMAAEWHNQALGQDKEGRARALAAALAAETPGSVLLRTLGRQYPGEPGRRWGYGLLSRRDAVSLWDGPPDPLIGGTALDGESLASFAAGVVDKLTGPGWSGFSFGGLAAGEHRIILSTDGRPVDSAMRSDPRLLRRSAHAPMRDSNAVVDALAAEGWYLLIISLLEEDQRPFASLELPQLGDGDRLLELLGVVERAAKESGLGGLILRGHPPVAGRNLRWTTVAPGPGVIGVNQVSADGLCELLLENRRLFELAAAEELSPFRVHYNGQVEDLGGGGQLSIGGPTPEQSPFFTKPHLLPALVRYLNHHPALSYWFAPQYVGAFSQAPRPDEGIPDLFRELEVALQYLAAARTPTPELLWRTLSPLLRDASGNAQRSEINVRKLWNPFPATDSVAGIVGLGAFRMARTPESQAALAALVRSIIAMLTVHSFDQPLVHWGDQLHDRFALPFYIEQDLDSVLQDLADTGAAVPDPLIERLHREFSREIAGVRYGDHSLTLSTALEFWPEVGDTMGQPPDSRLVDASTARLEVRLSGGLAEGLEELQLSVNGYSLPMRLERMGAVPVRVSGLRYRRYSYSHGLHPSIEPQLPIRVELYNRSSGLLLTAELHEWRPGGGAYSGFPEDLRDAKKRRRARLLSRQTREITPPSSRAPPPFALTDYCFDLRRV